MDAKETAWEIFVKYTELLAKKLGVNPTIEDVQRKVDELLKNYNDYQFITNLQNDAERFVWNWAKTVGLDTGDEVYEEFNTIRFKYGF